MPAAATAPAPPPPLAGRSLVPLRPGAPPSALLGVAAAALVAAGLVGQAPGVGVLLLAVVVVVVVGVVRAPGTERQHRRRWQRVHAGAAVLLAASAAVRDAGWLVALDLAAAVLLATLSLAPVTTWAEVLSAPLRPPARVGTALGWLLRGARTAVRSLRARLAPSRPATGAPRTSRLGPALRGAAVTAVLLAVFVPLLRGADTRFSGVLAAVLAAVDDAVVQVLRAVAPGPVDLLAGRVLAGALTAVAVGAALVVAGDVRDGGRPPRRPRLGGRRPAPVLVRRVEWLLPLAALDGLLAAFLLVRATAPEDPGATLADQVHAGFAQLVVATALVLVVVALAVRWTPMTAGPRAALAALCLLSLGLDAAAVSDLHAYVEAYGLTRLRVGVAAVCAGLGGLLVLLLVAGARWRQRRRQPWVPHAAAVVAAACLLGLTAADPDDAVARSQLDRGRRAGAVDTGYLATLSADATPALAAALRADPRLLGEPGPCLVAATAPSPVPDGGGAGGWLSANLARAVAERSVAGLPACR